MKISYLKEHNTESFTQCLESSLAPSTGGPGPVLYSREKGARQNKTKSDWIKVTSHVITFLLWLYIESTYIQNKKQSGRLLYW